MEDNQEKKESKNRSRLYPRYDLEEAIKFIEAVSKLGGSRVSQEAVAAELGKAVNNSVFIGRVSSSKQFGLISQESGKLSLTSVGKEIMFPRGDAEKKAAIKKAFSSPTFYKELIDAFSGKTIPEASALGNRLVHDYGIEASAKDLAARNFVRSVEYAGLSQNGILLISDDDSSAPAPEEKTSQNIGSRNAGFAKEEVSSNGQFVFEFSGGIKLLVPRNERTSEAIADGELKNARKALSEFAEKFVDSESESAGKNLSKET